MTEQEILAEAKRIAPWFWPADPWSVDLSCRQGRQRVIAQIQAKYAAQVAAPDSPTEGAKNG